MSKEKDFVKIRKKFLNTINFINMRVEIQQAIAQTPNIDRVQINVSNPQVAEAIKHAEKLAEKAEAQKKAEVVVQISKSESVEPLKDEDRRRKALITEKKEKKGDNKKEKGEENEKGEREERKEGIALSPSEKPISTKESRKIDIKA